MPMIIKKDGSFQKFDESKIISAIQKSAQRCCVNLSDNDKDAVVDYVKKECDSRATNISVKELHNIVECALDRVNGVVAKAYREYRNYKKEFSAIIDRVYNKKISLDSESDRSNANADSSLVTTQKAIVYNELNSLLYDKFFLNDEERQAVSDGYIYIHDKGSRYDSINCCLFDMKNVLTGGFFMGNLDYEEPKSLDVAFDLIADVTLNAASSQYGGFTIPEVDKLIAPYAELSYKHYLDEYKSVVESSGGTYDDVAADKYAYSKIVRDMEQGVQGWEMKLNSVASSRGDYPFTAITFGLGTGRWETLFSSVCMRVRKEGQGKKGFKHPVLFPKLSFFYDDELHGEGKEFEWLFNEAIDCSSKSMYPDFISLTGKGYQCDIYKKYKTPISRMGALAGCEHLYISIDGKEPIDISIKDLFDYFDKNKEINARMCRVYFNKARQLNKDYSRYKIKHDKCDFEEKPGVYAITYIPEDVTYIGGSENIARRVIEHRHHIVKYGGVDGGVNFNCYDCSKFKFEVLEYSEDYKKLESEYIKKIPNVNFRGFSNKFYKSKTTYKDVLERPYIPENKNREQRIIDISLLDVKVLDKDNNWTKVNTIFKNDKLNSPAMMHIYYSENNKIYCLSCTEDHPLWNGSSFVRADKLKVGDCIYRADGLCLPITKVTYHWMYCESYDISTATGTFIGSDIIMHNCRAQLSPWFVKGGVTPLDETDYPVFNGRFNLGAITLHFPMIVAKAKEENKDFFDVLLYYLDLIRGIHLKTIEYLSHKKAGTNPLGFCQGGFLNGHLNPEDEIGKEFLKPMTISFGVIALNEASVLYNGKSISEDNSFAISVLKYINDYIAKYKKIDGVLYAIYGTPGESLCFSGETIVQCYNGNKKIKDVVEGDLVYSFNDEKNKVELKRVKWCRCTQDLAKVLKITFTNKQTVICTPNHPFAVMIKMEDDLKDVIEYRRADELKKGNRIKSNYIRMHEGSNENHTVENIEYLEDMIPVYNMEVEDNHNYFVGGDNGILVHNCHRQIKQFRKKYGIIKDVSDHDYTTNSFHCCVRDDINPIEKQDIEQPMYYLCTGGNIQYCRYPLQYNFDAIKTLVRRAMDMGFYEGVNLQLDYCSKCGTQFIDKDECPKCGSTDIVRIERMNGYLGYSKIRGRSMYSDERINELSERISM